MAPSAKLNGSPARVGSSEPEVPTYRMVAMKRGLPAWCGIELRVYHPAGRRRLAEPGAKKEARLSLRGGNRQRQIASDGGPIQSRELEQHRDLGGCVEIALGVLDVAGIEELAHDTPDALDEIPRELPHDPQHALGVAPEEHRVRCLPPAEDIEDEIPAGLQHRSHRSEGGEDGRPRDAVEHAAEDGHEVKPAQPVEVRGREIHDLEAEPRVSGGALTSQIDGDGGRVDPDHPDAAPRPLERVEPAIAANVEDAARRGAPLEDRLDLLRGLAPGVEGALEDRDGGVIVEERVDAHERLSLARAARRHARIARRCSASCVQANSRSQRVTGSGWAGSPSADGGRRRSAATSRSRAAASRRKIAGRPRPRAARTTRALNASSSAGVSYQTMRWP